MSKEELQDNIINTLEPYSSDELVGLPDTKTERIESLIESFDDLGIEYDNFGLNEFEGVDIKKAYPNYEHFMSVPEQHSRDKWLKALKKLYASDKSGNVRSDTITKLTAGWRPNEVFDFLNWVKYYESQNHLRYKKAQNILNNPLPGYFFRHQKKEPDVNDAITPQEAALSRAEKKRIIEFQRNKIISRIDSAEKLLRTEHGNMFAGEELEALMEAIYALKKKIQLVNKLSLATKLYEDMIFRTANKLENQGLVKSASVLKAIAQNEPVQLGAAEDSMKPSPIPSDDITTPPDVGALAPASPPPPTQESGTPGGLPSMGPGMPQTPGMLTDNTNPSVSALSPGVQGFLDNLDSSFTPAADIDEVEELIDHDLDDVSEVSDDLLITEAQAAPSALSPAGKPPAPATSPLPSKLPVDTSKEEKPRKGEVVPRAKSIEDGKGIAERPDATANKGSQVDQMLNSIFDNVTVDDVIEKLEDLSKVFSNREIPRQLALVDMMLNSLGLSTYFPGLAEAQNKALDSGNYISTRVDDILSKLRGNLPTNDIDFSGENTSDQAGSPTTNKVRDNLKNEKDQDQARKQKRKDKENAALDEHNQEEGGDVVGEGEEKEELDVDVAGDLASNLEQDDAVPTQNKPAPVAGPKTTAV